MHRDKVYFRKWRLWLKGEVPAWERLAPNWEVWVQVGSNVLEISHLQILS